MFYTIATFVTGFWRLLETRNISLWVLSTSKVIQQFVFVFIIYLHCKAVIILFARMIFQILVARNIFFFLLINSQPFIHSAAKKGYRARDHIGWNLLMT